MPPYRERLTVPPLWWLLLLGLVVSVWLAYQHAYGPTVSLPVAGGFLVAATAALVAYGRVRVQVDSTGFAAGRARLPLTAMGQVESLRGDDAREARGPGLSPVAYVLIRGYVKDVVRVWVDDAADPVPYWLISTRRPEQLVAALEAARSQAGADH